MKFDRLLFLILSSLFYQTLSFAQIKTNYELIDSLLDSSANEIVKSLNKQDSFTLNFIGSDDYLILKSKLIGHLQQKGFNLVKASEGSKTINFGLEEVGVNYSNLFRDGLFGTYFLKRTINLNFSAFTSDKFNIEK